MTKIRTIIDEEVTKYIYANITHKGKVRKCLYCNKVFTFRTKYHHFCSRYCYSSMHRIPGFIKRIVNHRD